MRVWELWLGSCWLLAVLLLAATGIWLSPGVELEAQWSNSHWLVVRAPAPLQVGDQLLAVGSHPLGPLSLLRDNVAIASREQLRNWLSEQQALHGALRQGQPLQVRRQGQNLSLDPRLRRQGLAVLHNPAAAHAPVGLVFFLVGWGTLWHMLRRPDLGDVPRRQARVFYLCCLSMATVYLTNCGSLLSPWGGSPGVFSLLNVLNIANFQLAPMLLFHFSWILARGSDRTPLWLKGLWVMCLGVAFSLSISLQGLLVPLLFLASLAVVVVASLRARARLQRQQMRWVLLGFAWGLGPWILLNGLPLLFTGRRWLSDTVPGAFLVCIPLAMAVAIHRYRLFELGSFFEGTLVYGLTLASLLLLEVGLLTFLGWQFLGPFEPSRALLVTAVLASSYGWIRSKVDRALGSLFRRNEPDTAGWLREFSGLAAGQSAEAIGPLLAECLQRWLGPSWIDWRAARAGARPGAFLEAGEEPCLRLCLGQGPDCLLGPLPQGRSYNVALLLTLARIAEQAALYLDNARLVENLLAERQRRLQEREQLLGDLHDGVGSALANIRMLSHQSEVQELAGDALFELQNFLYQGEGGQELSLSSQWWIAELRSYGNRIFEPKGVEFSVAARGELPARVSRYPALSLFRLVREALSNALRHAHPKRVQLIVDWGPPFRLRVIDDGSGRQGQVEGRGLKGMQSRLAELGGEFRCGQPPGGGTGFEVEVMLPKGLESS